MISDFLKEVYILVWRELKKFFGNPWILAMVLIQPILWIGLFGKAFNLTGLFTIPPEVLDTLPPYVTQQISSIFNSIIARFFGSSEIDYFSYMTVGMLAVMAFFAGTGGGMSLAWDRRTGYLNKLLVAPISRASIVLSRAVSSSVRSLMQAFILLLIALPLGLRLEVGSPVRILLSCLALILLGFSMSSLMLAITVRARRQETVIMAMNLINLPLIFSSNVLYPKANMPAWLQSIASVNPLTYTADILRGALLLSHSVTIGDMLYSLMRLAAISAIIILLGFYISLLGLKEK